MDVNAIAVALATKYATLAAPTGEPTGMRGATGLAPNAIGPTPYVVVTASVDQPSAITYGAQQRSTSLAMNVDFFLEKSADDPRQMTRLQRWVGALVDAPLTGVHLGLAPIVAGAWTETFQLGDLTYAGQSWAGIRLVVLVRLTEPITPTA